MKTKLLTLLAIVSIALFSSCSKDDDQTFDNSPLIGQWHDLQITTGNYLSSESEIIWTFKADNTSSTQAIIKINDSVISDVTSEQTYEYKGTYINFTNKSDNSTFTYNVTISGSSMTLGNEEKGYFDLTKK